MFVVKIPGINGLGKTQGCEKAPNEILNELRNIYSNEKGGVINFQGLDLEEIHLDNSNLEVSNDLIYRNSYEMYETKPRVVFLGGDHSVSYSTTRAFLDYCESKKNQGSSYDISFKNGSGLIRKKPCLVVFDAHSDCMTPMKEPTHEEWLRKLIEDGFPAENVLLVGVRNYYKDEVEFLRERKIQQINVNSIEEDIDNIADTIMEFCYGKEVYVSVDIDVVDPAFAPATGYPEPGGLTNRQLIYLIQRISRMKNLRAVDIVEINPEKEENGLTVKLGAKILAELI